MDAPRRERPTILDATTKGTVMACAVCAKPCAFTCSRCGAKAYCGVPCQSADWGEHKSTCTALPAAGAKGDAVERPVFIVLENRGEGEMRGFYNLQQAYDHAEATKGDIRRPCDYETCAESTLGASFMAAIFAPRDSQQRIVFADHPAYKRPVSATAEFRVRGRHSKVTAVFCADRGCTIHIAAVFAGANATQLAEAEVAKRIEADSMGLGSQWYHGTVRVV